MLACRQEKAAVRPAGQTLHVGTYANAVAVPATDGLPGLSVDGVGHGCKSFGTFTINAISQDADGQLQLLDATFVQYCDSPTGPSLRGRIRYVSRGDRSACRSVIEGMNVVP